MNDLLKLALEAHGGLERWRQLRVARANVSITEEHTVDVLGGARGLNYASDYKTSNGIIVPRKRRVFAYDGEKRKVPEPLLVAIDIHEIEFT
jgi:hypothetical protein